MNVIIFKQILFILFGASGTIVAILGLFTNRDKRPWIFKPIVILCSIVTILYVSVSSYLEILNRDQIFADLVISIGEPYVVNVDGTETDKFVKAADYLVVSYNTGFSLNASIEMTNVKTGETYFYNTPLIHDGYRIGNVSSGQYDIKITTNEYEVYSERITLNSTNMVWDGSKNVWDYTAFMFEDFYHEAISFQISIGNIEEYVEYPAFGISSDAISVYQIFSSEIDWENGGLLKGRFLGYRDVYTISNCITPTNMEPITIDMTHD